MKNKKLGIFEKLNKKILLLIIVIYLEFLDLKEKFEKRSKSKDLTTSEKVTINYKTYSFACLMNQFTLDSSIKPRDELVMAFMDIQELLLDESKEVINSKKLKYFRESCLEIIEPKNLLSDTSFWWASTLERVILIETIKMVLDDLSSLHFYLDENEIKMLLNKYVSKYKNTRNFFLISEMPPIRNEINRFLKVSF